MPFLEDFYYHFDLFTIGLAKIHSGFSITGYRKIQRNFWPPQQLQVYSAFETSYTLDTSPFVKYGFANILSWSDVCLFILLKQHFSKKKFQFNKVQFTNLFFMGHHFGIMYEKYVPNSRLNKRFSTMFFSRIFMALDLWPFWVNFYKWKEACIKVYFFAYGYLTFEHCCWKCYSFLMNWLLYLCQKSILWA